MTEKQCSKCEQIKNLSKFHKDSHSKDGHTFQCSDCRNLDNKNWRLGNPEKEKIHNQKQYQKDRERLGDIEYRKRKRLYDLKHHYQIDEAWYKSKLETQNFSCAICGSNLLNSNDLTTLQVDHNHSCCKEKNKSCGKCLRGLLCSRCNTGIAFFEDNVDFLQKAAQYLKNYDNS